jgi:tetratricopeptide (TPR) repeat protein
MDLYPRRRPFGSHPGPACRGCPDVHCGLRCSSLLRVARTTPSSLVASPRAWHLAQHDPPPHPAPANPVVFAYSALQESERAIELYKNRLAAAPDQIREYRFLANAYLRSGALEEAGKVIAAGRKLEPGDGTLLATEAELLDASGRHEEALAAWQALKQRDPDDLRPYFMSAFTLETLGRYQEAAAEWRHIISSLEASDDAVHTTWPKEMLARIEAKLAPADHDSDGAGN